MEIFNVAQLRKLGTEIFRAVDVPDDEADLVTKLLVRANLQGHDSHGVIRIPTYCQAIRKGQIRPGAKISIVRETANTALIDGKWGFGQSVATQAMEITIRKAEKNDIGSVALFNCNHVGRLWDYSVMAIEHDMIGIIVASCRRVHVAPFGGREKMLGTNPLCVATPAGKMEPFILDMATSAVAEGKVRVSLHKKEMLSNEWIIDKEGRPSKNPADLYDGGALLPLGGAVGYKGFGLGLAAEILGGTLSGFSFAHTKEFEIGNFLFLEALNISSFTPINEFKGRMDDLIMAMKTSKTAPGYSEILIPGELEFKTERTRLKEGIPIPETTWEQLAKTASELNLEVKKII